MLWGGHRQPGKPPHNIVYGNFKKFSHCEKHCKFYTISGGGGKGEKSHVLFHFFI